MNNDTIGSVHWSFRVIVVIALIWNGLGAINFFVQMNPDTLEAYRASERAMIEGRPSWATAAFGLAVFGGTVGSLLLLSRRPEAFYVLVASLVGVIVTMIHSLGADIQFGTGEILGIILMPLAVAVFLVWYSKYSRGKGWID